MSVKVVYDGMQDFIVLFFRQDLTKMDGNDVLV